MGLLPVHEAENVAALLRFVGKRTGRSPGRLPWLALTVPMGTCFTTDRSGLGSSPIGQGRR